MNSATLPPSMENAVNHATATLPQFPRLPQMFADTFANTFSTTLKSQADGSVFVITGDIPAMWLRDSAAQVRVYLPLAKSDPQFAALVAVQKVAQSAMSARRLSNKSVR